MSSDPLLQLDGIGKRFGGLTVLDGLSFSVQPGEIVGLVGPNGSGKTTAINLISGVLRADSGHILFAGQSIARLPAFRRVRLGINRSFQVPRPFREMTARENIEVGVHFGGGKAATTEEVLAEVDLLEQADSVAGGLTVNQQKMLDLGRALATNPRLLLIDEVGAGLNPAELNAVAALLEKLAARGIALVVVEHLLNFLNRITNRVIVLGAGRMLFEGTLRAASEDPEVIAAFIGG